MSEHPTEDHHDVAGEPVPGDPAETTGHPEVDEVIASLEGLDERPVSEHVPVFESAHERLRGALSDAGDDPAGS